jgi:hypothetical protein
VKLEPGHWMGRAISSLLLLLSIALVARYIWDLLSPMVPALVALIALAVISNIVFQRGRR